MPKTEEWGDEQVELDADAAVAESGGAEGVLQEGNALWIFIKRSSKRILVAIGGFLLIVAGVIMLVTPGPGWVAIFAGLALWATEFVWAERLLKKAKARAEAAKNAVMGKKGASAPPPELRSSVPKPLLTWADTVAPGRGTGDVPGRPYPSDSQRRSRE